MNKTKTFAAIVATVTVATVWAGAGVASAAELPSTHHDATRIQPNPTKEAELAGHGGEGINGVIRGDHSAPSSRVSSCDTWRNAVGLPGGYRAATGCYLIGSSKNTVVYYKWERTGGSSGSKACVQGKGFNANKAPVWQNAGCNASSGGTAILWGNVAASKQIRLYASSGLNVLVNWR